MKCKRLEHCITLVKFSWKEADIKKSIKILMKISVSDVQTFLTKEYFDFSHNNYRSFFLICFPYFLFLYPQALQTLCLGYMLEWKYFPCNWAAWRFGFLPRCTTSSPLVFYNGVAKLIHGQDQVENFGVSVLNILGYFSLPFTNITRWQLINLWIRKHLFPPLLGLSAQTITT